MRTRAAQPGATRTVVPEQAEAAVRTFCSLQRTISSTSVVTRSWSACGRLKYESRFGQCGSCALRETKPGAKPREEQPKRLYSIVPANSLDGHFTRCTPNASNSIASAAEWLTGIHAARLRDLLLLGVLSRTGRIVVTGGRRRAK